MTLFYRILISLPGHHLLYNNLPGYNYTDNFWFRGDCYVHDYIHCGGCCSYHNQCLVSLVLTLCAWGFN